MFDMIAKGGLLMWPILLCSVLAVAIVIHKAVQFSGAFRSVRLSVAEARKLRPPLLLPVLELVAKGGDEKAVTALGTRLVRGLERGMGSLSLISAVSPLLGLTGTVLGMIQAFQDIAGAGSSVDPSMLASGIWEALITTAAGLLVAIPAHVAHHYLDSRLNDIVFNFQELSQKILDEGAHAL